MIDYVHHTDPFFLFGESAIYRVDNRGLDISAHQCVAWPMYLMRLLLLSGFSRVRWLVLSLGISDPPQRQTVERGSPQQAISKWDFQSEDLAPVPSWLPDYIPGGF